MERVYQTIFGFVAHIKRFYESKELKKKFSDYVLLRLLFIYAVYLVFGALIFSYIEGNVAVSAFYYNGL